MAAAWAALNHSDKATVVAVHANLSVWMSDKALKLGLRDLQHLFRDSEERVTKDGVTLLRQISSPEASIYVEVMPVEENRAKKLMAEHLSLSPRHRDIMWLVWLGLPNKEIANVLSVSEGSIKSTSYHAYCRMGVDNRAAAVRALAEVFYGIKTKPQVLPTGDTQR
jgi:DNA-binding NarL/FixJ family response regulator